MRLAGAVASEAAADAPGSTQTAQLCREAREEAALGRKAEVELDDFFENGTIGLHWVGPDGTILRANRHELKMLGYEHAEYVGRHIAEFHVSQDAITEILRRLSAGGTIDNYEARLRCKDGSIRDVLISSIVLWEVGRFVHTRCFTTDITERKKAEEAQRLLVGELTHRVKNTLATVQALAKALEIELLYLPSYSPNLNLIERLWKFVKKECLSCRYYEDFARFEEAIAECLNGVQDKHKSSIRSLLTLNFQTFEEPQLLAG